MKHTSKLFKTKPQLIRETNFWFELLISTAVGFGIVSVIYFIGKLIINT